jgi:hypothetical protein
MSYKEIISKLNERRKWRKVFNEERGSNYRRLKNEMKSHRQDQEGIS